MRINILMVYTYCIIHDNVGVKVSSNKKRIAYISNLSQKSSDAATTDGGAVTTDAAETAHVIWKRCSSKTESAQFIKDNTSAVLVPQVIADSPQPLETNDEMQCRMTALLLKKHKSGLIKKKRTPEEIETYNATIEQYDDGFVPDYFVYTDGSCSRNGTPDAIAGYGVYFGEDDPRNLSNAVPKTNNNPTNNVAELLAILEAVSIIRDDLSAGKKITIVSDSQYAIDCATTYGEKCNEFEWDYDMPNKDLVKRVYFACFTCPNLRFRHIRAHTTSRGIHALGNKAADKLARGGCLK